MSRKDNLIWIDLEMTGLNPDRNLIIEIATVITDKELTVLAEGDYVVQFGLRAGTWQGGSFLGFDVSPGPYSRNVAFCYRIQDGKIAERWAMRDDLTMLRQLGAFTAQH